MKLKEIRRSPLSAGRPDQRTGSAATAAREPLVEAALNLHPSATK
jgi:hypothetical protein